MAAESPEYVARKYIDKSDVEILVDAVKANQNILLLGPRGTGKTSLAKVVAHKLGRKFCCVPCHTGATSEALIGQWIPNPDGTGYVWMDGILTNAVRKGYICLLDEVNSLKSEVAFAIHGLLDHRRELVLTEKPGPDGEPEVIRAHKDFGFIAAGNPFYEGVRVMNEAFRDRFAVQLTLGYHQELDIAVIRAHPATANVSPEMAASMEQFVAKVRNAAKTNIIRSDISTRAFLDLVENIGTHTFQTARTMFLCRFSDDEAEVTALRTCFNDVWTAEGKPLAPDKKSEEQIKKGRAGRFATKVSNGMSQNAEETF